jgi:predicted ArsR family transcriptional regulator
MATKLDYLKDLADHAGSTGGEAAARLDVPEATVLEAYRRCRRQGLIDGNGGRPEKFTLTESGITQLRVMQEQSNSKPALSPNLEKKFSDLEQGLNDSQDDIRGLFRLVDQVLGAKRDSALRDVDTSNEIEDDLHEQVSTLEAKLKKCSLALEFYTVSLRRGPFGGSREMLEARKDALSSQLDSDAQQEITRLIALEAELAEENGKFFGPAADVVRELVAEIGHLREKNGFASMDLGEP